jgi:hypothetical protein
MHSNVVFGETFSQLLRSLNDNRVPYLIIGGYATGFYGYVRATKELDLWIEPDEQHTVALVKALQALKIRLPAVEMMRHLREASGLRLGADIDRIDLIFQVAGVEFATCYVRRIEMELDDMRVAFISLADLRASKMAAGRLQDQLDLENLPPG